MCGIIGYVGNKSATPILMEALSRLEYRGYDSAGVAVLADKGPIGLRKAVGKLHNLEAKIGQSPVHGTLGIGHTRWATHGSPSAGNCHPQQDCAKDICVVHNGIIENYRELKDELEKRGHRFKSQTDTEVLAHLVEEQLKNGSRDLVSAVQKSLKKIVGAYALGIIRRQEPGLLVAVRQGSPLVIGIGEQEKFIASDAAAILGRTRNIAYLEDGCIAAIRAGESKITDGKGKVYAAKINKVSWNHEASSKGSYDKFMAKEIHEQPEIIAQTLKRRIPKGDGNIVLEDLHLSSDWIKKISKITIVSCGTAYYAGLVGKYLLERYLSVPVELVAASEYRYRPRPEQRERKSVDKYSLLIAVSQSGETADTLAGLREAKARGCKVLSICNVVGSTMTRESDSIIYTHAGPEISVASTKAYTAQLFAFHLLTLHLARRRGELTSLQARTILKDLNKVPRQMEQIFKEENKIKALARKFSSAKSIFYLGRGFNYATALEGALKNKEISYMHAEGYPAGELKHGPIAMIDSKFPVVCICTRSSTYDKMISNIKEVEARKGRIIILASADDEQIRRLGEDVFYLPVTTEEISPILNIVPLQLLAYHIARLKGCDIDKPRNLAKSVTVE